MKRFEFSKIILCCVMATYFLGLAFGMAVILKSPSDTALCGLFSFIGAPVAAAIGFYSYKAKAENVEKIRSGYNKPSEGEEMADDGDIKNKF